MPFDLYRAHFNIPRYVCCLLLCVPGEVKIVLAQTWFHIEQMDKAIEQVLSPDTTYTSTSTSTSTLSNDASTAYLQEPKEVAEAKAAWFREHNRGGCGPRS